MASPSSTLILGASGFLGREVLSAFAARGRAVGVGLRGGGAVASADIRDPDVLRALVERERPDLVLLLAAYREPDFCEAHPEETRRLNVAPARVLREILPVETRLGFVGTDYVFDGRHPPYREDSARNPINVYGRSKVEAEDVLAGRPNTFVLRVPLLVGGGRTLKDCGFLAQAMEVLRAEHPAAQDDVLVRFPTWTRDVAEALAFLAARREEGVFHYSAPAGGTRYHWICETARALGLSHGHVKPSPVSPQRPAERPRDCRLLPERLRALGFDRATPFAEVVRAVMAELPPE